MTEWTPTIEACERCGRALERYCRSLGTWIDWWSCRAEFDRDVCTTCEQGIFDACWDYYEQLDKAAEEANP